MMNSSSRVGFMYLINQDKYEDFILNKKNKNRRIVGSCLGVIRETKGMKRCMVTLTPKDCQMCTLKKLRTNFFNILESKKNRKYNGDESIKYISNIEFSEINQIPHIHIVLFYKNKKPILDTFTKVLKINKMNRKSNDLRFESEKYKVNHLYIIKDYRFFNSNLELYKHFNYKNFRFFTSSRKSIPRKVILYLYRTLKFKTTNKYSEILNLIDKKLLLITTNEINCSEYLQNRLLTIKSLNKIGNNYVYIFKNIRCTYKIKRLIKGRKPKRIKFISRKRKVILDF